MSTIIYNVIISPIELIVEVIFELMFRLVGHRETNQGFAVIGVSVAISLLTLPLYHNADAVQQKQRIIQKKMEHWVNHIRRTFKGDERFMMLNTYYRQNNYSPIMALRGSISLLLEIPFFIAAYHFLSHLNVLEGASFGPITNLGTPDKLIKLGTISLNLLPILMTTINCISSAIYLKGFPIKDKIQTYGMALIFLVLLYNSPSGLVVYWTCNNIFSLVKNIFYKIKNPLKVLGIICASLGLILTIAAIYKGVLTSKRRIIFIFFFLLCSFIPLVINFVNNFEKKGLIVSINNKSNFTQLSWSGYILLGLLLVVITGILIPSAVISSSPTEFVDIKNYRNPLLYLKSSTCYAIGFFILWSCIIRYMLNEKYKSFIDFLLFVLSGVFIINYMCFGRNLGVLSSLLVYEDGINFSKNLKLINLIVTLVVFVIFVFLFRYKKLVTAMIIIILTCLGIVSCRQIYKTQKNLNNMAYIKELEQSNIPEHIISLSKTGKNIIVFMLDRAISGYVPYILEEKPEIKKQFEGFTYYPNTISYGFFTNFGTPALFGGYEYTITEMNKRSSELLVEKHNESLKVMPVLFSQNNFKVTVCDPPYAGYKWISDLSVFDDCSGVEAKILSGQFQNESTFFSEDIITANNRNFFMFSIFRCLPLAVSQIVYDNGNYLSVYNFTSYNPGFIKEYSTLEKLSAITEISDSIENTFLSICNCTTHDTQILQLPDYKPDLIINNSGFSTAADGHIKMDNENQIMHYHSNMAAFIQLGKWFDYMRENGVWDNTRIILVADHGRGLGQFDNMIMENIGLDIEWCNPLLMVKDFNSNEYITSDIFMTNADVPTLATNGVIDNPVNPFTGNVISMEEKNSHPQIITSSMYYDIDVNNGTTFDTKDGYFYSVHDNIFEENNWSLVQ